MTCDHKFIDSKCGWAPDDRNSMPKAMSNQMRSLEQIAVDTLQCATAHEPASRIVGNVRADELALLAMRHIASWGLGSNRWR